MMFDQAAFNWFQTHRPLMFDPIMRLINKGLSLQYCILWTALIALFLAWKKHRWEAMVFFGGMVIGATLLPVLKILFHRQRPPLGIPLRTYSFPSGHALGNLLFWGLLAWVLARLDPHHSILYKSCAALIILIVGWNRLYLGVHWLSDVLGGYAAGGLFLWLWTAAMGKKEKNGFANSSFSTRPI